MDSDPSSSSSSSATTTVRLPANAPSRTDQEEDDTDALFEELENNIDDDFDLGGFRERRMEQLKAEVVKAKKMKDNNYGRLTEVKAEKDVITLTANAKRSVLHFFHRDFRRCKIMDKHLEKLASKHFDTLFIRAEVSNVPFLVNKIDVKVLPCVVGFVNGISKMKIVGFEELDINEGGEDFSSASLELTMLQCGVLNLTPGSDPLQTLATLTGSSSTSKGRSHPRRGIRTGNRSDDEDLDD